MKCVKRLQDRSSAPNTLRPKVDVRRKFVSDGETLMAGALFELFCSDEEEAAADDVVDLRSDDGPPSSLSPPSPPPRSTSDVDDRRELREARQLPGFHIIDPQRKEQVSTVSPK